MAASSHPEGSSRFTRRDLVSVGVVALLALVITAALQRPLLTAGVYGAGDPAFDFVPNFALYARVLQEEAAIVLWSFHDNVGRPLMAEGYRGLLHPLTLLLYGLLPFGVAHQLHLILPVVIGAVCMLLLCRGVGIGSWGAAAAAAAFTINGSVQSFAPDPSLTTTYMLLPLALLCAVRLMQGGRGRWIAGLALVVGLTGLGGYPVVLWWLLVGVGVYALADLLVFGRPIWRLLAVIAGGTIGLGLAAVQLLPTLELLARSSLVSAPLEPYYHLSGSFPPPSVLSFFLAREHELLSRFGSYGYVGQVVSLLAAVGIFLRDRRRLPWLFAGLAVLLISFGKYTPLFYLWEQLPIASMLRLPARALMLLNVFMGVVAGLTVEALVYRARQVRPAARSALLLLVGMLSVAVALPYVLPPVLRAATRMASVPTAFSQLVARDAGKALLELERQPDLLVLSPADFGFVPLVFVLALVLLLRTSARRWLRWGIVAALLLAGVVQQIDYRRALRRSSQTRIALAECELASYLRWQSEGYRIVTLPEDPKASPMVGYETADGLCSVDADLNVMHGLLSASHHHFALSTREYYQFMFGDEEPLLPRLRRAAVRFVVVDHEHDNRLRLQERALVEQLQPMRCFDTNCVYQVPHPLPIGFVTHDALLNRLGGPTTDRVEPVAVELRANTVRASVELDRPGHFVFSQLFYPGWKAYVDGSPAPLLRGDDLLQAVPVAAGRHEVELVFRPLSLQIGLAISGVMACLLWGLFRTDRQGSSCTADRRRDGPPAPVPATAPLEATPLDRSSQS